MGTKAKTRVTVGSGGTRQRTRPSFFSQKGKYVSAPAAAEASKSLAPKSLGKVVGGKGCSLSGIILGVLVVAVIGVIAYFVTKGGSGVTSTTATEPTPSIAVSDGCTISRPEVSYLGTDSSFDGYHKIRIQFCDYLIEGAEYDVEVERNVSGNTINYDASADLYGSYSEDYYGKYETQMMFVIEDSVQPGTYDFKLSVSGEITGNYSLGSLSVGN